MPASPPPLPDYLRPGLDVVFVGINPGWMSATVGHYFANPRNDFWRLLHDAGLTPRRLAPDEDRLMLDLGYGLTDVVKRPSRQAAEVRPEEFAAGRTLLEAKLLEAAPRIVCFNGKMGAVGYFGRAASIGFGRQPARIGDAQVFVAPSTSPANAGVPYEARRRAFADLKAWKDELASARAAERDAGG